MIDGELNSQYQCKIVELNSTGMSIVGVVACIVVVSVSVNGEAPETSSIESSWVSIAHDKPHRCSYASSACGEETSRSNSMHFYPNASDIRPIRPHCFYRIAIFVMCVLVSASFLCSYGHVAIPLRLLYNRRVYEKQLMLGSKSYCDHNASMALRRAQSLIC